MISKTLLLTIDLIKLYKIRIDKYINIRAVIDRQIDRCVFGCISGQAHLPANCGPTIVVKSTASARGKLHPTNIRFSTQPLLILGLISLFHFDSGFSPRTIIALFVLALECPFVRPCSSDSHFDSTVSQTSPTSLICAAFWLETDNANRDV